MKKRSTPRYRKTEIGIEIGSVFYGAKINEYTFNPESEYPIKEVTGKGEEYDFRDMFHIGCELLLDKSCMDGPEEELAERLRKSKESVSDVEYRKLERDARRQIFEYENIRAKRRLEGTKHIIKILQEEEIPFILRRKWYGGVYYHLPNLEK